MYFTHATIVQIEKTWGRFDDLLLLWLRDRMIGRRTYCYDSSQNLAGLRLIMTIGMESLQRFCMCLSAKLPSSSCLPFEDTYDKYDK